LLASVDGLSALTSISGHLSLQGNDSLASLRGFAPLANIQGFFTIRNNPLLPTCEAEWLHDRLTGIAELDSIEGNDDAGVCAE
jgi:hypothetical protein